MSDLPLKGVRIIAIEQYGAGPYGSMYLANLGAEVIKIESPALGGDIARQTGPFFLGKDDSYFFQTFNLNKKSLSLDIKTASGRDIFNELIKTADAVCNNLRGDQPEKLNITYPQLKAINPKIVCAHLSAYGRDNDRTTWPGYDYLMQAEAGFMSLTGEPEQAPARFGLSMVDFMTGAVTALGLTAALFNAYRTGKGCDVDVSLFDVALHQLTYPATWYLNEQHETKRVARSAHPSTVPCQLYKSQDGWIFLMVMTEKFWQVFLDILDDDILRQSRFDNVAKRRELRDELTVEIDRVISKKTTADWQALFQGKIPSAPVYDLPQALNNPYIRDIGMVQTLQHPQNQAMEILASPIKVNGERGQANVASSIGADTESLLTDLGYNTDQIQQFKQHGAI
ncbi:CaiB/BaiF CoA transferase family protein [Colwellia sp. MEBiC06753]